MQSTEAYSTFGGEGVKLTAVKQTLGEVQNTEAYSDVTHYTFRGNEDSGQNT